MNALSTTLDSTHCLYGSDVIIAILKQHGIKYVACNPGATIRGLHDSIVNDTDKNALSLILCCHEEIAVAIAHGYAKTTGKVMAVLIHTNVGLQHASMAVFNAWCDRVPMLLIGGLGPLDASKRRPWIDWIHTSHDQASVIRGFIKWEDQPLGLQSTKDALYRALRITNTAPHAPVYVGIDATTQEECLTTPFMLNDINRFAPAPPPCADETTLQCLADKLIRAHHPVIVVDYMGENPDSIAHLVALAELLALPIIDKGGRYNFPNNHSLYMGSDGKALLSIADVILAIDVHDLYGAFGAFDKNQDAYVNHLHKAAFIAHISLSDYLISSAVADYQQLVPIDLPIAASSTTVLPALTRLCKAHMNAGIIETVMQRQTEIEKKHRELKANHRAIARSQLANHPMTIPAVLLALWQAIEYESWVLANGGNTGILDWIRKLWTLDKPGCYFGFSGGAGLGYGLGASIGAALTYKDTDTICINLQTDGDFLFTPSALWTAAHEAVPLLIIMMNNRAYHNTKEHAAHIALTRGRVEANATIGSDLTGPNVDYPKLAASFGIKVFETVTNIEDIGITVKQALDYIKTHKKPVLVDFIIE